MKISLLNILLNKENLTDYQLIDLKKNYNLKKIDFHLLLSIFESYIFSLIIKDQRNINSIYEKLFNNIKNFILNPDKLDFSILEYENNINKIIINYKLKEENNMFRFIETILINNILKLKEDFKICFNLMIFNKIIKAKINIININFLKEQRNKIKNFIDQLYFFVFILIKNIKTLEINQNSEIEKIILINQITFQLIQLKIIQQNELYNYQKIKELELKILKNKLKNI